MSDTKKVSFFIYSHSRLQFQQIEKLVFSFIESRLSYFGYDNLFFFSNREHAYDALMKYYNQYDYCVFYDAMNPFLDINLIKHQINMLSESENSVSTVSGAIPGTQPEFVIKSNSFNKEKAPFQADALCNIRWWTQAKHNNQFNLYKYKRIKIFLSLLKLDGSLKSISIPDLCEKLASSDVHTKIATYFVDGNSSYYKNCPYCGGNFQELMSATSQPMIGYLSSNKPVYFECMHCKLIVLSPHLANDSTPNLYDEYDTQDFKVSQTNPVAFYENARRMDFTSIKKYMPESPMVLDLGGGMGHFSRELKKINPTWKVTHSDFAAKENVWLNELGIETKRLNFLQDKIGDFQYDLITAWEVIEHIPFEKISDVFKNIWNALRPEGFLIFSTPDFDSPVCQMFDYYNVAVPFHYAVYRASWIKNYFKEHKEWELLPLRHTSDFLDDAKMWFEYCSKTAPTFQTRAMAQVFLEIFSNDGASKIKRDLLHKGYGTEMIVTLRKR